MTTEPILELASKIRENPNVLFARISFRYHETDEADVMLLMSLSDRTPVHAIVSLVYYTWKPLVMPELRIHWSDDDLGYGQYGLGRLMDGFSNRPELFVGFDSHLNTLIGSGTPRVLQSLMQIRGLLMAMPTDPDKNHQKGYERFVKGIRDHVNQENRRAREFGIIT